MVAGVRARAVCNGGGHHVAVVAGQRPAGDLVDDARVPGAVRLHHALGQAGGAARELDGLRGVARQCVAHWLASGVLPQQGVQAHSVFLVAFLSVLKMDARAVRGRRQGIAGGVDDDDGRFGGVQDAPDLARGAAMATRVCGSGSSPCSAAANARVSAASCA
ncbi:hypothetical protein G6F35_016422 [Rhizopus arrhizus]|nr:hypothetical protein G6F35_016422 [Rhizopus arrhizus]